MSYFNPSKYRRKLTAHEHFVRRRELRESKRGEAGFRLRLGQIFWTPHLYACASRLKAEGGPAAGVDGVRLDELSNQELGEVVVALSRSVSGGRYAPRAEREVRIPKPHKPGQFRTLRIPTVADRVAGAAFLDSLGPFWESVFLACSYGFRAGRSHLHLLADLKARADGRGLPVLLVADVHGAFDHVPIRRLMELHEAGLLALNQPSLPKRERLRTLRLLEILVRGLPAREVGISQGAPYSPTALNVLLHYTLDEPINAFIGDKPFFGRYADNLVVAAGGVSEGERIRDRTTQLLSQAGLSLNGSETLLTDLSSGQETPVLGFSVRRVEGEISFGVSPSAWASLEEAFHEAHSQENPPLKAQQASRGWIEALGPALPNGDVIEGVMSKARGCGFRELNPDLLHSQSEASTRRWRSLLKRARKSVK